MLIIHALYIVTKSNVCILCTLQSASGSMIQRWPCVHFTCNVIHSSQLTKVVHLTSALLVWIEDRIMILDHVLT